MTARFKKGSDSYFDRGKAVIDGLRGVDARLRKFACFNRELAKKPGELDRRVTTRDKPLRRFIPQYLPENANHRLR